MIGMRVVVIGAGVIGLAIAAELSSLADELIVLDREDSYGRGVSSRNSQVIHAGLYYPPDSLKARLCVEGRDRLYALCAEAGLPHRRTGKLIVGVTAEDDAYLDHIASNARATGARVEDINGSQAAALEPAVRCVRALFSPDTGVVDAHSLMTWLHHRIVSAGGEFVYRTRVTSLTVSNGGYRIATETPDGDTYAIDADLVINSAGLESDRIAGLLGFSYTLHWCKGCYCSVRASKARMCSRLVYPAVPKHAPGLGIHVALDLDGRMRLGPDTQYIDRVEDYSVPADRPAKFHDAVSRYLPDITREDLEPESSGIRPKLQGPGEPFADFVIREERPGFVNLVGMDSPGLTASLAIGRYVRCDVLRT
jgi:L-2-hydroxyglutarate oxidase LhgO